MDNSRISVVYRRGALDPLSRGPVGNVSPFHLVDCGLRAISDALVVGKKFSTDYNEHVPVANRETPEAGPRFWVCVAYQGPTGAEKDETYHLIIPDPNRPKGAIIVVVATVADTMAWTMMRADLSTEDALRPSDDRQPG